MARVILTRDKDGLGWTYEVVGDRNSVVAGGWVRGTKREASAAAAEHAREKGLVVDA